MKTTLQFETRNDNAPSPVAPFAKPQMRRFEAGILSDEFLDRRLRLEVGTTKIRIVPALAGSAVGWMLGIHVQEYTGGRFVHPRSLKPNAKSVFDEAYKWMQTHRPGDLYSKENKDGVRLLTDPYLVCWVLVEEHGRTVSRLMLGGGYDGRRGGTCGFGFQLLRIAQQTDANGKLILDAVDPQAGCEILVTKTQAPGMRYPSYSMALARDAAPIEPMLAKMEADEVAAIRPLEEVVRTASPEEQWDALTATLGAELVKEIRGAKTA